jgi:hypothetical protein
MQNLKQFYDNETQREEVKAFMVMCLEEMAVDKTFAGDDVTGIKEARDLIDKTFDKLAELYGTIPKITSTNSR